MDGVDIIYAYYIEQGQCDWDKRVIANTHGAKKHPQQDVFKYVRYELYQQAEDELAEVVRELHRLEDRLEIYCTKGNNVELYDGIECRDTTIRLLEDKIKNLVKRWEDDNSSGD